MGWDGDLGSPAVHRVGMCSDLLGLRTAPHPWPFRFAASQPRKRGEGEVLLNLGVLDRREREDEAMFCDVQ